MSFWVIKWLYCNEKIHVTKQHDGLPVLYCMVWKDFL